MSKVKREIRVGSIVNVAGVGAVIDVGSESFVIPGIDGWKAPMLRNLELQRLSSRLRKKLRTPRDENPRLMVRRFPRTLFCERCRRLTMWKTEYERDGEAPSCPNCKRQGSLVPMRFVVACEKGHLQEFPWGAWAHSGPSGDRGCRDRETLEFLVDKTRGGGGLDSLLVRCRTCRSQRSLDGIMSRERTKGILTTCSGRHPWRFQPDGQCDATPEVMQRGATNLHYPATVSALDIPVTEGAQDDSGLYAEEVMRHPKFERLRSLLESSEGVGELAEALAEAIAAKVGCDAEVAVNLARNPPAADGPTSSSSGTTDPFDQDALLLEEWHTLDRAMAHGLTGHHFVAEPEELHPGAPEWARRLFRGVLLIRRMREVRAFLGFQRIRPGSRDLVVPPDVGNEQPWVPATEAYGEGIFLAARPEVLQEWAGSLPRGELELVQRLEKHRKKENFWFLPPVDPILLALHSLSHLLIRRITFECGYSSSSLAERLYIGGRPPHAGLMIYTSDADSEGSLGGLVRQGRQDRLAQTLFEAVEEGRWCSADPVCSETAGQGLGGFNRASCHACLLVPETSCVMTNALLDRRLLMDPQWGLIRFCGAET